MKLNKDQIARLKKLTSYKGYPQIDVQYEILDHVACRVEELMNQNSGLSLDEAFSKVHSEFGVFGFSELEESYKKSIQTKVLKNFWSELKNLFTSYRLIYPIGIAFIFYQSSVLLKNSNLWLFLMIGFVLLASLSIVIRFWKQSKAYKKYASFMASAICFQLINLGIVIALNAFQLTLKTQESTFDKIFAGVILLGLGILFISIFIIPKVVKRSIEETEKLIAIYES